MYACTPNNCDLSTIRYTMFVVIVITLRTVCFLLIFSRHTSPKPDFDNQFDIFYHTHLFSFVIYYFDFQSFGFEHN